MTAGAVPLRKRAAAEASGTAALLAIVVGSGIMAERLAGGSAGLALLANSLATGAGLFVLILALGPVSGAHLNPVVTLMEAVHRRVAWRDASAYVAAQLAGAYVGVALAHGMFGLPVLSASSHARSGLALALSELVATLGLLAVVHSVSRSRPAALPLAVGGYVTSAYWFTASTSFANPAVTLARAATDTFCGIRPADVPGFLAAQVAAAALGTCLLPWVLGTADPARAPSCGTSGGAGPEEGRGIA